MKQENLQLKIIGFSVAAAAIIALLLVWPSFSNQIEHYGAKPNLPANLHNQRVILEVAKLTDLPSNEEPNIYTLKDPSKLPPNDLFFKGAKAFDEYMIYVHNQVRILYRPSTNTIINQQRVKAEGLQ